MIRLFLTSSSAPRLFPLLALASAVLAPFSVADEPSCPPSLRSVLTQFVSRHRHVGAAVADVGRRSAREVESVIRDAITNFLMKDSGLSAAQRAGLMTLNTLMEPVAPVLWVPKIIYNEYRSGLRALWRVPIQYVRERGVPLTVHLTFALVGSQLVILNEDFLDETDSDFLAQADSGVIVIANLYGEGGEEEFATSAALMRQRYPGRSIIEIEALGYGDLTHQLIEVSRAIPIAGLHVEAHGTPGGFSTGSESLLTAQTIQSLRRDRSVIRFVPGATIRVASCNSGLGEQGQELAQTLGNYYLGENGGRVILSNRFYYGKNTQPVYSALQESFQRSLVFHGIAGASTVISYPSELGSFVSEGSIRRLEIPRGGIPAAAPQQSAE